METYIHYLIFVWEEDRQDQIWSVCVKIVHTVDEGLVHVKNDSFLFYRDESEDFTLRLVRLWE